MKSYSPVTLTRAAIVSLSIGFLLLMALPKPALSHGDVSPQPVDVSTLESLGDEWRDTNPYEASPAVVTIGASAYNQNCARCHGLGAKSGGIAPDLRELPADDDSDAWFISKARNGAIRNGVTYMPAFEGILPQEAMWAIRTWIETVSDAQ